LQSRSSLIDRRRDGCAVSLQNDQSVRRPLFKIIAHIDGSRVSQVGRLGDPNGIRDGEDNR
jgi:hypothetical protein